MAEIVKHFQTRLDQEEILVLLENVLVDQFELIPLVWFSDMAIASSSSDDYYHHSPLQALGSDLHTSGRFVSKAVATIPRHGPVYLYCCSFIYPSQY
ncbi:hypothetical protein GQ457_17G007370 [Hibiscus cannabinus]